MVTRRRVKGFFTCFLISFSNANSHGDGGGSFFFNGSSLRRYASSLSCIPSTVSRYPSTGLRVLSRHPSFWRLCLSSFCLPRGIWTPGHIYIHATHTPGMSPGCIWGLISCIFQNIVRISEVPGFTYMRIFISFSTVSYTITTPANQADPDPDICRKNPQTHPKKFTKF
jgi:hypothetical protein